MALSTMCPLWAEPGSCRTWLYHRRALGNVENSKSIKSHLRTSAKGYLFSIFHPWDRLEKAIGQAIPSFPSYSQHQSCTTWNLVLIRLVGKALPVSSKRLRTELNSVPAFAETASATNCNFKSTATHSLPLSNTRISVQLRFARDKFTAPLF